MNRTKTNTPGFTIVELLIVIVVIGVLAAVTVVAFNGIQQRANNTKTQQAVAAYAKAMILYAQDNGVYPLPTNLVCLGDEYTEAEKCDGSADLTRAAALKVVLEEYLPGTPPRPAIADVGGRRGALYHAQSYILFTQEGVTQCPSIGGTTRTLGDTAVTGGMWCRASLPAL